QCCNLTVVAEDNHLVKSPVSLSHINGAEGHRIIYTIYPGNVRIRCQNSREPSLCLATIPISRLVSDDIDIGISAESFEAAMGALITDNNAWGSVENSDLATATHHFAHCLTNGDSAKVVIHFHMNRVRLNGINIQGDNRDACVTRSRDRRPKRNAVHRLQEYRV